MTRAARRLRPSQVCVTAGIVVAEISEPGPSPDRSAAATGTGGPCSAENELYVALKSHVAAGIASGRSLNPVSTNATAATAAKIFLANPAGLFTDERRMGATLPEPA